MKKLILSLSGAFLALFLYSTSYAQNELSFVSQSFDGKDFRLPVNELNSKAVRHFNHDFKFAENETWFKIKDGFTAKFMMDNIQYRVGYDKKGNWLNTMKIYHEAEMPQTIRHQVKSIYYDYAITQIQELELKNQIVYIVHIDNNDGFKKLYISDDEMNVMEEYSK